MSLDADLDEEQTETNANTHPRQYYPKLFDTSDPGAEVDGGSYAE